MKICPHCGRIAASNKHQCPACQGDYHRLPATSDPSPGRKWGLLSVEFTCSGCSFPVPLNRLELSGHVRCDYCGMEHALAPRDLKELTAVFRQLLSFTGDSRPAVDSPAWTALGATLSMEAYDQLRFTGISSCEIKLTQAAWGTTYRVSVAPGAPLCESCRTPLSLAALEAGRGSLRCGGCGAQSAYLLPQGATALPEVLLAVAPEHREGTLQIDGDAEIPSSATALICPKCGGTLSPPVTGRLTSCDFCDARVVVSSSLTGATGNPEPVQPWWALLQVDEASVQLLPPPAPPADDYLTREQERLNLQVEMTEREWEARRAARAGRLRGRLLLGLFFVGVAVIGLTLLSRLGLRDRLEQRMSLTAEDNSEWEEPSARAAASRVKGALTIVSEKGDTRLDFVSCVFNPSTGRILLRTGTGQGSTVAIPIREAHASAHFSLLRRFSASIASSEARGETPACSTLAFSYSNRSRTKREVSLAGTLSLDCTATLLPSRRYRGKKETVTLRGKVVFSQCR